MKKRYTIFGISLLLSLFCLVVVGSFQKNIILRPLDLGDGLDPAQVPFLLFGDEDLKANIDIARTLLERDDTENTGNGVAENMPLPEPEAPGSPAPMPPDNASAEVGTPLPSVGDTQADGAQDDDSDIGKDVTTRPPESTDGESELKDESEQNAGDGIEEGIEGGSAAAPADEPAGKKDAALSNDSGGAPEDGQASDGGDDSAPAWNGESADGSGTQAQEDSTASTLGGPVTPPEAQVVTGTSGVFDPAGAVNDSWFDDALFIGDSRTDGMRLYARLGNADYFCATGMSVFSVLKKTASDKTFSGLTLSELLGSRSYGKVFIGLGVNECGYSLDTLMTAYEKLVATVRELQPGAKIILQGIMACGRGKAAYNACFGPENLSRINESIKALADGSTVFYIDVNEVFADPEGYLPDEFSRDGCHLYAKYYPDWVSWIKTAVAALAIDSSAAPAADAGFQPDSASPGSDIYPDTAGHPGVAEYPGAGTYPGIPVYPDLPTYPDIPVYPDVPSYPDIPVNRNAPVSPEKESGTPVGDTQQNDPEEYGTTTDPENGAAQTRAFYSFIQ